MSKVCVFWLCSFCFFLFSKCDLKQYWSSLDDAMQLTSKLSGKSAGPVIERFWNRIPAGAPGEFSSPESALCDDSYRCPFHPRVTAVARKRPRPFWQKCRWQVTLKHAYTLDPSKSEWADYAAVQAECWNLSGNELTRNPSGNTRSQSSQLVEPLWTDPGPKS